MGTYTQLSRTASWFDPASDWTRTGWVQEYGEIPSSSRFRTYWAFGDKDFTASYVGLFSGVDASNISVGAWDGSTPYTTANASTTIDAWVPVGLVYSASGHTLKLWVNGTLVDTLSVNFSTFTFSLTGDYLGSGYDGNDVSTQSDIGWAYCGVWQRAMTPTELLAQLNSATVLDATSLLAFTPLASPASLTDTSGNGRGWTSSGPTLVSLTGPTFVVTVTCPAATTGTVGVAYSSSIAATGGQIPYAYSLASGSLPTGLSLNSSTGAITGTPTVAATYPFTSRATDDNGNVGTNNCSITIAPVVTLSITCATSSATVGVAYSSSVVASGGTGPYTYSITSGSIPAGLTLNTSTGAITGTPTTAITYNYTVHAVDTLANAGNSNCSIAVVGVPPLPNITPATAIAIPSLPACYTVSADGMNSAPASGFTPSCYGTLHTLWYSYVPTAGQTVIGLTVADSSNRANISVWSGSVGSPTQLDDACTQELYPAGIQVNVTPGTTYYIQLDGGRDPVIASNTLCVLPPPNALNPVGSILVLNDILGFPATVLAEADGEVLTSLALPTTEMGDNLPSGVFALMSEDPATGFVTSVDIYAADLTLTLQSTAAVDRVNQVTLSPLRANRVDTFWTLAIDNTNPATLGSLSSAGVVSGTTWTLPADSTNCEAMAVNDAATIVYYAETVGGHCKIHRYDLIGLAPLADLIDFGATTSAGRDLFVLPSGNLLIPYRTGSTTFSAAIVTPAGSVSRTDAIGTNSGSDARFALGVDYTTYTSMSFPVSGTSRFTTRLLSNGSTVNTFDALNWSPGSSTPIFAQAQSCPLLILRAAACVPPEVTIQPATQSLDTGQSVTLSVAATGTETLTYQWYQGAAGDTSTPLFGEISSTYTTPALTVTTSYWVRATNDCGTDDSSAALLVVQSLGSITQGDCIRMPLLAPTPRQNAYRVGAAVPFARLTSTRTTYADSLLMTPNDNPQIADSTGLFGPIYLAQNVAYDFELRTAGGIFIWAQTDVSVGANCDPPSDGNTAFAPNIIQTEAFL